MTREAVWLTSLDGAGAGTPVGWRSLAAAIVEGPAGFGAALRDASLLIKLDAGAESGAEQAPCVSRRKGARHAMDNRLKRVSPSVRVIFDMQMVV
jgi:hypothetical protein